MIHFDSLKRTTVSTTLLLVAIIALVSCGGSVKQQNIVTTQQEVIVELPYVKGVKIDTIHIGKMNEDEIYKGEFTVYNKGTEPVVITGIRVECGCTKTQFDPSPIMVGESRKIDFTFDSEHRKGEQKRGMIVKLSDGSRFTVIFDAEVTPKENNENTIKN